MQERYIYVSFANADLPEVRKLIEKLEAMGVRVSYPNGNASGSDGAGEIANKVKGSSCLVVYLTENSANSAWVQREIDFAVCQGIEIVTVCPKELSLPPETSFSLYNGRMIRGNENADQLAEELCRIAAVKACREETKEDLFHTAEIPLASGCPEPPQENPEELCQTCGQKLSKGARFCHFCGSARGAAPAFSAPPPVSRSASVPPPPVMSRTCAASPTAGKGFPSMPSKAPASDSAVPIRKKSMGKRLKDFLCGNKMTDVNFSVLTPAVFEKENYTMVDVYAYEEEFRHVVEQVKAERAKQEGTMKESDGGHLQIKKGARITVRLSSPDLEISDNEETRVWAGKYVKFDFPVFVPEDYKRSQILFCADVYFDDVIATRIRFVVSCVGITKQRPKLEQKDVRSAFISYASGDRERVALILQGMRRSRPDLDVFFDVEALRTGESWENILRSEIDKRDVLYLCWSQLARESEWVDMEWRYALKQKGLDGIEPIPLTLPKDCPPPEELKGKHFGARELYYQ